MTELDTQDVDEAVTDRPLAPIELRGASVADLKVKERIVTVIVAPYEQPTSVMWNDEVWQESFERSAWDALRKPARVRANRGHDRGRTCGRAIRFHPDNSEGLLAEVRMAKTLLGDETLALAEDDCLSVSAGFAARTEDQRIDRRSKTRKITTAYLDHIAFVENPAYPGARVVDVRQDGMFVPRENEIIVPDERQMSKITPLMDEFLEDPEFMALLNSAKLP